MTKRLVSAFLFVFFAFAILSAWEKTTLIGVVQALETNEEGAATSTYIETDDDSITVAAKGKGLELNKYVGYKVKITGEVSQDDDGNTVITVESFSVVEDN